MQVQRLYLKPLRQSLSCIKFGISSSLFCFVFFRLRTNLQFEIVQSYLLFKTELLDQVFPALLVTSVYFNKLLILCTLKILNKIRK